MRALLLLTLLGVCVGVPLVDRAQQTAEPKATATNPAEPVVIGVERVIAKSLLKLNRTLTFKASDDRAFQTQLDNATAFANRQKAKMDAADECITSAQNKAEDGRKEIIRVVKQKKSLSDSVRLLKRAMEMRVLAKDKLVNQVVMWHGHVHEDSQKRLADLEKSSAALLGVIKANKVHMDPPLSPPSSTPTNQIPTGGTQNIGGVANTSPDAMQPTATEHLITSTTKVNVEQDPSGSTKVSTEQGTDVSSDQGTDVSTAPVFLSLAEVTRRLRGVPPLEGTEDEEPAPSGKNYRTKHACVTFGFGAMMAKTAGKCELTDEAACDLPEGMVGQGMELYKGKDCEQALSEHEAKRKQEPASEDPTQLNGGQFEEPLVAASPKCICCGKETEPDPKFGCPACKKCVEKPAEDAEEKEEETAAVHQNDKCADVHCDACPEGYAFEEDSTCCGKCTDPLAGIEGPKKCPDDPKTKKGRIAQTNCAWPEEKECSFGARKCCGKQGPAFSCVCVDGRVICMDVEKCDCEDKKEEGGDKEEAGSKAKGGLEEGGGDLGSDIAFSSLQMDILGMLKEYGGVHDELSDQLKQKLQRASATVPPKGAEQDDNAVHEVVVEELTQAIEKLTTAQDAEQAAIEAAESAILQCTADKKEATPFVQAAQIRLDAIQKKKDASDEYYAKHVLTFRETIEFAQATLTEMEQRATTEFSGGDRDEKLAQMRTEIDRILDMCSKLVSKKGSKLVSKKGCKKKGCKGKKGPNGMGVIHHLDQQTVATAAARTTTNEVMVAIPLFAKQHAST